MGSNPTVRQVFGWGLVAVGTAISFVNPGIGAAFILTGNAFVASGKAMGLQDEIEENKVNVTGAEVPLPVVYGRAVVGAKIVDVRAVDNLLLLAAVAVGSQDGDGIEGIQRVFFYGNYEEPALVLGSLAGEYGYAFGPGLANDLVPLPPFSKIDTTSDFYDLLEFEYAVAGQQKGTYVQSAPGSLVSTFPSKWTSDMGLRGVAYANHVFFYDEEIWTGGLPEIQYEVLGNRVWDPRTDAWAWSDNPALCLLDYLTSDGYGAGLDLSELDVPSFIANANYFDEVTDVYQPYGIGGPSVNIKRGTINGTLSTGDSIMDNINKILVSCRGQLVYQNGIYRLQVNKEEVPSSFVLNEDVIIGDWSFSRAGARDVPNKVTTSFVDRWVRWEADQVSFPDGGAANPYLDVDNGFENNVTISLPMVDNAVLAWNIAQTYLVEAREDIQFSVSVTEEALQLQIGDVVPVTHATPGWENFLVRVTGIDIEPTGDMRLYCQQYSPFAYDLDPETSLPRVPGSNLPNPFFVQPPSGLLLVSDDTTALETQDGQFLPQIKAEWEHSLDPYVVKYEVQFFRTQDDDDIPLPESQWEVRDMPDVKHVRDPDHNPDIDPPLTESAYITPVTNLRAYRVRVRALNNLGRRSEWVESDIVVSTQVGGADGGFSDIVKLEYFDVSGAPWVRVVLEVRDPREVLLPDGVTAYAQSGDPSAGGPVLGIPAIESYTVKAPEVGGVNEGKYVWEIKLSEKHLGVVAYAILYNDPLEPDVIQRVLWLDIGDDANIVFITISYEDDVATVNVKGDADTASLYAEESADGLTGWGAVVEPTPAFVGNRFSLERRGSFSVAVRNDRRRFLRIRGMNHSDAFGPWEEVQINKKDEIEPENRVKIESLTWDINRGETGQTGIQDGGVANRIARMAIRVPDLTPAIESLRITYGPETFTATPVEGNYVILAGTGLTNIVVGDTATSDAEFWPGSYSVNTTFQVAAYTNTFGTGTAQSFDTGILLVDDPITQDSYLFSGTEFRGPSLSLGTGLSMVLNAQGLPEISVGALGTLAVSGGGTGRDLLVSGDILIGAGVDPVAYIEHPRAGSARYLSATGGIGTEAYSWVESAGGIQTIVGSDGITVTGTGTSRTIAPDIYTGTALNVGQLFFFNNQLAVSLGTTSRAALRGDWPLSRNINSGTGLTGGGNLTTDRTLALTGQALSLHNLATTGLFARTGAGAIASRSIAAGNGITVTNGDASAGNPTITIGTPGSLSGETTNSSTASSHTHALDTSVATVTVSGTAPGGSPTRVGQIHFVV